MGLCWSWEEFWVARIMNESVMRKLLLGLVIGLPFLLCQAQQPQIDAGTIEKLEESIRPGNYPKWGYGDRPPVISEYIRFYAVRTRHGRRLLLGEFLLPDMISEKAAAGIRIVTSEKDFPEVFDGGCGVIHVEYDLSGARLISLTCNGQA